MFLLLVLVRNPYVFMKSIAYLLLLRSFPVYIKENISLVQEATGHGLAGMPSGSTGGLSYAYTAAHSFARIELYRASRPVALRGSVGRQVWRKLYGPVTPGDRELHELAAVVNKITGYATVRELGVSPAQARLERALLFPRYLRCLIGLLFDAAQGRTRGNESRIIVASTLGIAAEISLLIYLYL